MSAINNGGPAFARAYSADPMRYNPAQEGMSLRDYFAGEALAPMVAHRVSGHVSYGNEVEIAKRAYEIADAMLAERAK